MSASARDYALPIDGNTHTIPCGPGRFLAADIDHDPTLTPTQAQVAYLWIRQHPSYPKTTRTFLALTQRQPWPDNAEHLSSVRTTLSDGSGWTVHVLEIP